MKLEKHFERLCKKAVFADDILLALIDYIMINENNHYIRSYNLLEEILRRYHKNDKGFNNTRTIILNDDERELFKALKSRFVVDASLDNNFYAVKNYPHLFDDYLKYYAGVVFDDGKIGNQQLGAERTFFVGMPIYDLENNKLGVLSYVYDEDDKSYWWKILGYKGESQKIKTYWQVLKEREPKVKELIAKKETNQ